MHDSESILKNENHKILWDFVIQIDYRIPTRTAARPLMDFAVPVDHRVKIKEGEKRSTFLDFVRELNKLWNMRVTMIPIVTMCSERSLKVW